MAIEVRLTQGSNSPFYYLLATQPLASIEACSTFARLPNGENKAVYCISQDFSTPGPDALFPTIYFTDHRQLWVHILVVFGPRGKGALSSQLEFKNWEKNSDWLDWGYDTHWTPTMGTLIGPDWVTCPSTAKVLCSGYPQNHLVGVVGAVSQKKSWVEGILYWGRQNSKCML